MTVVRAAVLVVSVLALASPAGARAAAPNILFLISDDHSSFSLGCYGSSVRTPNLDRLAADGVRFTNAFVASPQCSPSRSAIMTGLSPHRTNTSRLHTPLRREHQTLLDHLKSDGYYTGGFRKHHLGPELREKFDFYQNDKNWDAFFDARPEDKPFFLWVGFTDPHRDYESGAADPPHDPAKVEVPPFLPDTPAVRADLALYHDAVTRMDADCGDILALLDKHGLTENTLVLFFGDNGMPFPGAKGTLYDPGIRVPLIARWPAKRTSPGGATVVDDLISLVDLFSTCLDVAGLKPPPRVEGVSILPLITGEGKSGRTEIFSERNWHDNLDLARCVRTDRFKLIYNCRSEVPYEPIADLRRSPTWQAILESREELPAQMRRRFFQSPRPVFELYDLHADPNETKNLAGEAAHARTQEDLEARLSKWMEQSNDFLPPPQTARRIERQNRARRGKADGAATSTTAPAP